MIRNEELGIVADDLTGACDVAACFARVVGPVDVCVDAGDCDFSDGLTVINTQSRHLKPGIAAGTLTTVGRKLAGRRIIFKKTCSALRGSFGAEIEGLLRGIGPRKVIVAPAIPAIGRTTKNGRQFDCGVPIDETAYAKDPVSPITTADIQEIVSLTGSVSVVIRDAESGDDLKQIVESEIDGGPVLFVGSLGLADALAGVMENCDASRRTAPTAERLLVISGSMYERSARQVAAATAECGAGVVLVNPADSTRAEADWPTDRDCLVLQFSPEVSGEPDVLMNYLVQRMREAVRDFKPDGLAVIGGETAFAILKELGATRLGIGGRLAEVISCGVIERGAMTGCPVATKGGSVGPDEAVSLMIYYLRNGSLCTT